MNIGKNLQQSFDLTMKNISLLFFASLISIVLSFVSFGILAGPLAAGMLVICFKLLRGETATVSDVFSRFDKFVPTFLLCLLTLLAGVVVSIISSIPLIGLLIQLAFAPALGLIFFLALAYIISKDLELMPAIKQAINDFLANPVINWLYYLVFGIIVGLGAIPGMIIGAVLTPFMWQAALLLTVPLTFVGVCLTLSIGVFAMALAYQELSATESVPKFKFDKKTLQIAGIVVAVLFLIGLFYNGRSYRHFSTFGPLGSFAPRWFNTPFGKVSTDGKEENFTLKTKDGAINVGTGLPKDFPNDIPIQPGSTVNGYLAGSNNESTGSTTTLSVKSPINEVTAFYQDKMKANGWEVEIAEFGDLKTIGCTKQNRKVSIMATPGEQQTEVIIGISQE